MDVKNCGARSETDQRLILGDGRPQASTHHLETFARTLRQTLGSRHGRGDRGALRVLGIHPQLCLYDFGPVSSLFFTDHFEFGVFLVPTSLTGP